MAPSIESLCEKTGKQITEWLWMSLFSWLYCPNGRTDSAPFWHRRISQLIIHCILSKFWYLQKSVYFFLELFSNSGLRKKFFHGPLTQLSDRPSTFVYMAVGVNWQRVVQVRLRQLRPLLEPAVYNTHTHTTVLLLVWNMSGVLDTQTQNGDEPVGEYSFPGQSCLSSADSWWNG